MAKTQPCNGGVGSKYCLRNSCSQMQCQMEDLISNSTFDEAEVFSDLRCRKGIQSVQKFLKVNMEDGSRH